MCGASLWALLTFAVTNILFPIRGLTVCIIYRDLRMCILVIGLISVAISAGDEHKLSCSRSGTGSGPAQAFKFNVQQCSYP